MNEPITPAQRRRLYAMADDYWGVEGNPGTRDLIRATDERTQKLERELPVVRWMARGAVAAVASIVAVIVILWQRIPGSG